jgi:hypothetical protein
VVRRTGEGNRGWTTGWRGARPAVVRRGRPAGTWRGADFKASRGAGVLGKAQGLGGCAGLGRHDGADAEGGRRRHATSRRGARLTRNCFTVPWFECENLQKFE